MKQPILLSIGHKKLLLPDDAGIGAILTKLSRALQVNDRRYYTENGSIEVLDCGADISVEYLGPSTRFTNEKGQKIQPNAKPAKPLALRG